MTLVARPIPIPPPQILEDHPLPTESFKDPGIYPAAYNPVKMNPEEINSGSQAQAMDYGSSAFYAPNYSHDMSTQPLMPMASSQMTTPSSGSEEAFIPMGSPSMRSSSRSGSRSPQRGNRSGTAVRRRQTRNRRVLSDSGFRIEGPISQLTESFHTTPIKDMDAWVARSPFERQDEVRKKNGKISRPMNSFMLYRSAYAERTKRLVGANNHQIVSKIAGQGWKLEPPEIRRKYEDLAKIERDNHAATHPDYKFSPNKNPASSRRDSSSPSAMPVHLDEESFSEIDSEYGSSASGLGRARPFAHSRSESFEDSFYSSSRDSSPFGGPDSMMAPGYVHPSWQNTSHPNGLSPQSSSLQGPSYTEDGLLRSTTPNNQDIGYGSSLAGLPGAAHHELLQPQLAHTRSMPMHDMDPRLLSNGSDPTGVILTSSSYPPGPGTYSTWADETHGGYYVTSSPPSMPPNTVAYPSSNMTSAYLPSMQNLEVRDPSWDISRPESHITEPTAGEFDLWCTNEGAPNY